MDCREFRDSILEALGGELPEEKQTDFARHEAGCAACQRELARSQAVEAALRRGWPVEEPPPGLNLAFRPMSAPWWEAAWRWFSFASAALVTASLVALVILRPSVAWQGKRLEMAFSGSAVSNPLASQQVTQAQVQAWVRAAVQNAVATESAAGGAPQAALASSSKPSEAKRWGEVSSRLQLLRDSQAYLWNQVEEQQLNLRSLWQLTAERAKPAPQSNPGTE